MRGSKWRAGVIVLLTLLPFHTVRSHADNATQPMQSTIEIDRQNAEAILKAVEERLDNNSCSPRYCRTDMDCGSGDACGFCWASLCGPPGVESVPATDGN